MRNLEDARSIHYYDDPSVPALSYDTSGQSSAEGRPKSSGRKYSAP
jgi:hypothetical protein